MIDFDVFDLRIEIKKALMGSTSWTQRIPERSSIADWADPLLHLIEAEIAGRLVSTMHTVRH